MIIKFFYEGGPVFMSLVYLMWIIVISLVVRFIILYRGTKNPLKLKRTNDGILFFGSFAFLIGISGQMIGLMAAFDSIQRTGYPSIAPQIIAGGLKVSFIPTVFGMFLLLLSAIIWFVCRNLKEYPLQKISLNP